MELDVRRAIVPIVRLDTKGRVIALEGTGFYVGDRPCVVTAAHVVRAALKAGETLAIVFVRPDEEFGIGTIRDYVCSPKYDVAAFPAATVPGVVKLRLSSQQVPPNQDILTHEFSSTSIAEKDGVRHVNFSPLTHKGNAMRHYVSEYPEAVPTPVFDTSFPALQGASGAPVLRAYDFAAVGISWLTTNGTWCRPRSLGSKSTRVSVRRSGTFFRLVRRSRLA